MESKWGPKGAKNRGNSWTFRATFPRRLQGGQMDPKRSPNGAKMEPKRSQKDPTWTSNLKKIVENSMEILRKTQENLWDFCWESTEK